MAAEARSRWPRASTGDRGAPGIPDEEQRHRREPLRPRARPPSTRSAQVSGVIATSERDRSRAREERPVLPSARAPLAPFRVPAGRPAPGRRIPELARLEHAPQREARGRLLPGRPGRGSGSGSSAPRSRPTRGSRRGPSRPRAPSRSSSSCGTSSRTRRTARPRRAPRRPTESRRQSAITTSQKRTERSQGYAARKHGARNQPARPEPAQEHQFQQISPRRTPLSPRPRFPRPSATKIPPPHQCNRSPTAPGVAVIRFRGARIPRSSRNPWRHQTHADEPGRATPLLQVTSSAPRHGLAGKRSLTQRDNERASGTSTKSPQFHAADLVQSNRAACIRTPSQVPTEARARAAQRLT